ncbi:hypothetical protein [Vulcanisaeta distributa]|uniref:hypothetical protein n=1 Tax=Vulcanisaeta distributa TaxID=164451 RepID=UPI0006D0FF88|nr:hypothetical protein [Vulcanisaeta distributa]
MGGARRVGDKYLLPIQAVPWFTLVDLGREYPVNDLVVRALPLRGGPLTSPGSTWSSGSWLVTT